MRELTFYYGAMGSGKTSELLKSRHGKIEDGFEVVVMKPFIDKTKANIVEVGMKLEVPYHLTYSCYNGEEKPCGKCATCIDRAEAIAKAGFSDPALEYSI